MMTPRLPFWQLALAIFGSTDYDPALATLAAQTMTPRLLFGSLRLLITRLPFRQLARTDCRPAPAFSAARACR